MLPVLSANQGNVTVDVTNLPPNQFDRRNLTGSRWVEMGAAFEPSTDPNDPESAQDLPLSESDKPFEINFPTGSFHDELSYDKQYAFRFLTLGIELYFMRHGAKAFWQTLPVPPAPPNPGVPGVVEYRPWDERDRQPIAVTCTQLQQNSRFFTMLVSDSGQGLAGAASVNIVGDLPPTLTFRFGILDPVPKETTLYHFNCSRYATVPVDTPNEPLGTLNQAAPTRPFFNTQRIESLIVRLYLTAHYEPNRVPVFVPSGMGRAAPGIAPIASGAVAEGASDDPMSGPGIEGGGPDISLEGALSLLSMARTSPDMIPTFVHTISNAFKTGPVPPIVQLLHAQLQELVGNPALGTFFQQRSMGEGPAKKNAV